MSVVEKELPYWLAVSSIPKMGPKRIENLLAQGRVLSHFFNDREPTRDFGLVCQTLGFQEPPVLDWFSVDRALSWQDSENYRHILTWEDSRYPAQLKQIGGSPPLLFVEGEPAVISTRQLAMVGSRQPSTEGRSNAYYFAFELSRCGFTITSGLARGIDGASHEGALQAQGKTIAVLGQGMGCPIYPAQHRRLADSIRANGAILSEFPLHAGPIAGHFPRRNRIISGLSLGVLVVECAQKSGSLITAQYAVEQNREVFALPGSIHSPLAKGCHALIRQGAKCVDTLEHIVEEFPKEKMTPAFSVICDEGPLLPCLGPRYSSIDELIERSGLTAEQVSSMLIALELQGKVACVPGGYVRIMTGGLP